ncbi:hypothetical protein GCG54_00015255 [Colletotrichum gloeosporioides]|uniref:Ubiquitin-like protease family profile domain-containing protein n=1 Tax=Colletotrichum gloeosporioides TaxID=474922 RepID=A0A8H4C6Y7_COLGL|nr:uncharacterized protein GCG54_00015255 [Colletotrichum gloeosporioides]KAF3798551.1 hypothetical protein GCG54_00015255 [Colletotrichum gloeosporioides]
MSGSSDNDKVPRQSDVRRAAQMRETGVTPSLFRSVLRSDQPGNLSGLWQALKQADIPIKKEPDTSKPAGQPTISASGAPKTDEQHQQEAIRTKSTGAATQPVSTLNQPEIRVVDSSKDVIDLTADDALVSAILAGPTQTDRQTALANFEPCGWLNDINIDVLLKHLASKNPSVGLLSSWDTGILRRSRNERLPEILQKRFASLAKKELWIAPVSYNGHWVVFVGRRNESIDYYDSIIAGSYKVEATKILYEFLRCVWGNDAKLPEPKTRQPNGFDCGLHVIRNADLVTQLNRPANAIPPLHPDELRRYYRTMYENLLD